MPDETRRHLLAAIPGQAAGAVLRGACDRLDELDGADLRVAGGDTVRVVCLSEVEDWLRGLAARTEAGEPL